MAVLAACCCALLVSGLVGLVVVKPPERLAVTRLRRPAVAEVPPPPREVSPARSTTTTTLHPGSLEGGPRVGALFLSSAIGVAEVTTETSIGPTGCSAVYATTDFSTWRAITPPASMDQLGGCTTSWSDAYFVSATTGWIQGRFGGGDDTVLYHTVDGGRSWQQEPGGTTGSNGGYETIQFANASDGIRQQFPVGANGPVTVDHTTDGGTTFTTLRGQGTDCEETYSQQVFADADDGFAPVGNPLATSFVNEEGPSPGGLCETTDGGHDWSETILPPPPGYDNALAVYDDPTFTDPTHGIEPVLFIPRQGGAVMAFYDTADTGRSWTLSDLRPAQTSSDPVYPGATYGHLHVPTAGVSISGARWLIGDGHGPDVTASGAHRTLEIGGPTLPSTVQVAGETGPWSTVTPKGLPAGTLNCLYAANASVAWAGVVQESGEDQTGGELVQTLDGGRTWTPVAPTPLGADYFGGC